MSKDTNIEMKYGFPLFTLDKSIFPFKSNKTIISDIWSFWDYIIKNLPINNKSHTLFLLSLLEQAKHFYITAENSPTRSKPLLYYYSFLNLSKIFISVRDKGVHFNRSIMYMHGLNENHNNKFENSIIIKQKQKNNIVQVAHEICSIFDANFPTTSINLNAKDLLMHCIGIHRAYSEIYSQKEIFVKIKQYELIKRGKTLIFRAELDCLQKDINSLMQAGRYTITQDNNKYYFEEQIVMKNYIPTRKEYSILSQQIRDKGIWYFIGNNGLTLYLSKHPDNRYSQESIIYLIMFYLGSITRYHPYMFDDLFSQQEQWLISEFLTTQPKQFLYLATSRVLGHNILKAYASF